MPDTVVVRIPPSATGAVSGAASVTESLATRPPVKVVGMPEPSTWYWIAVR